MGRDRTCMANRWAFWLLVMVPTIIPTAWGAIQNEIEPDALAPGLIATFSAEEADAPAAVRVEDDLIVNWDRGAPDARVPADGFTGHWQGLLLIQSPGIHHFHARTDGALRMTIGGHIVLHGSGDEFDTLPVDLPPGLSTITVEYRHAKGPSHLAIDWEGPGFAREPLPGRLLFHEATEERAKPRLDRFEEGRRLADRLGCANCHAVLDLPSHRDLGPPLADAGRAIDTDWLAAWLRDPPKLRPGTRMPGFGHGLPPSDVADLIAFLERKASKLADPSGEIQMAMNVADPAKGRLLFRSAGCLGCHTRGSLGDDLHTNPAAPDLNDLGRKRSERWLAMFLASPKSGARNRHRPGLRLNADAAANLAAYLVSNPPLELVPFDVVAGDPRRGRELAGTYRCASCHEIPDLAPLTADIPLRQGTNPLAGCLADEPAGTKVPRYHLSDQQLGDLRALIAGLPAKPSASPAWTLARDTIRRRNCLGCHTRDGQGGDPLGPQVAAALAEDPALGSLKGTLTPPDLSAVGDKLRREFLALAVRGEAPTARPWLSVHMPSYPFAPGEAEAIVAYLRGHDRMTATADPTERTTEPDDATVEAAANLIGQRGFGCISCHVLAGKIPPGGEPETLGPDLALAHERMTERYFRRWLADPQRIIPGTPMPQFLKPVEVHPGTLDDQLATIWTLLGSERVAEAAAFGTREILKRQGDRAMVVRDMVLLPEKHVAYNPRGLAIGLKNDQSLLFDTDRLAWVAWWNGGFLSRTKSGRLWEWHPEGTPLWTTPELASPVVLIGPGGVIVPPRAVRERFGSFTELVFGQENVTLHYTLHGPAGATLRVRERVAPEDSGWRREVWVEGTPEGYQPALREAISKDVSPTDDGLRWMVGSSALRLRTSARALSEQDNAAGAAWLIPMKATGDGAFEAVVELTIAEAD